MYIYRRPPPSSGMVLDDTRTIESYNVDESKFIVVMVNKAPAAASPAAATAAANPTSQPPAAAAASSAPGTSSPSSGLCTAVDAVGLGDAAEKKSTSESTPTSPPAAATPVPAAAAAADPVAAQLVAEQAFLIGDEYNRIVDNIMEMGYTRDQVRQALRASFNNPDRAAEYLLSGVPLNPVEDTEMDIGSSATAPPPPAAAAAPSAAAPARAAGGPPAAATTTNPAGEIQIPVGQSSDDPLGFLRTQPQFQQMRHLIHQNPDFLNAVLQQIGQTNPALLQLICDNQEEFLNMLNEPGNAPAGATARSATTAPTTPASSGDPAADPAQLLAAHRLLAAAADRAASADPAAPAAAPPNAAAAMIAAAEEADALAAAQMLEPIALQITPADQQSIDRVRKCCFSS